VGVYTSLGGSSTNYGAYAVNSSGMVTGSILGPAFDTAAHVHEFWRDGSTGHYAVDGVVQGTADIRSTVDCVPTVFAASGGSPTLIADWEWFAFAYVLP
jgi:hypothetical protein